MFVATFTAIICTLFPNKYSHHLLQIFLLNNSQQMTGAMWFVSSLFSVSVLFLLTSKLSGYLSSAIGRSKAREHIRFSIVLLFYITGHYIAHLKYRLPAWLDVSFVLLMFYYCGYLYRKHEHKIPLNISLAIVAFIALIICMRLGVPQIAERQYVNPIFLLFCGLAGTYLHIYLANKCASVKKSNFVNYAGRNTMAILALHFLAFKVVSLFIIYAHGLPTSSLASFPIIRESNQFYRWAYASSGLVLPLLGTYVFDTIAMKINSLKA